MSILKTLMKIMNNVSNHVPENGWKSSTIWLIIPKWAASALGSLFSQYAGGSGTSGSI